MAERKAALAEDQVTQKKRSGGRQRRVTREQVLDAAEEVFATRGFHGASVQEIAGAAGCTTGVLYWSFKGKDDIFLEVLRRRRTVREQHWREALGAALDSPQGAIEMGRTIVPDPAWYGAMLEFMVHAARKPELHGAVVDISGLSTREPFLVELLEQVAGSSSLPVDRLAAVIRALVLGFGEMWFAEPERADPTLFAQAFALLAGTGAPLAGIGPSSRKRSGVVSSSKPTVSSKRSKKSDQKEKL
jgi:AcrR family transcriptional regulator